MITKKYKKIAVIGYAGSGKTTCALRLHQKLALPLYHLDRYYWLPNWKRGCYKTFTDIHDTLCEQDAWIIEGVNLKILHKRLQSADLIIFLDLPRYVCVWRVLKRSLFGRGTVTPGSPEGCKQRFLSLQLLSLLQWVWNFNNRYRTSLHQTLEEYKTSKEIYILKSPKEAALFLDS